MSSIVETACHGALSAMDFQLGVFHVPHSSWNHRRWNNLTRTPDLSTEGQYSQYQESRIFVCFG